MGGKHFKRVDIAFSQRGGAMTVKASERDGFGSYSIQINYGVCYVYHKGNLIAAASNFTFQVI